MRFFYKNYPRPPLSGRAYIIILIPRGQKALNEVRTHPPTWIQSIDSGSQYFKERMQQRMP